MKGTFISFFWKPIYPYWVIAHVVVLLAVGITVIHLNEIWRWVAKISRETTSKEIDYVNRTN